MQASNADMDMQRLYDIAWIQKDRAKLYTPIPNTQQEALKCAFSFTPGQPKEVVIRREYHPALQDAISFFHGVIRFNTTYTDEDKEWGMLTDSNAAAATHEEKTDDESKMVVDSDKAEEDKLLQIDWQTEKTIHLAKQVFIVTGSPGIGKTLWLYFVLVERLLRNLPTYFQTEPDVVSFWSENGVSQLATASLSSKMSSNIWYLVDSNPKVIDPPWDVQLSESRIVVAASRRKFRFKWLEKLGMSYYKWIMKPTSLPELVIMNPYQKVQITMEQLYAFAELFGTCARQVYQHAADLETYREELAGNLKDMTFDDLGTLVEGSRQEQSDKESISHWIVGVYPGPTRKEPYVAIYTSEILELVQHRFASEWDQRVWELFDALRQEPYTRAPAGRILENRLHETLAGGGTWEGTEMTARPGGRKNTYFTDNVLGRRRVWLSLGPGAKISTSEPPKVGRTVLPVYRFRSGELKGKLPTGYYRPFSQTHPTFDSFVLDVEQQTVVVIQSAMSMEHDVKPKGLQILEEKWQKSGYRICFVIITDNRDETKTVDIPILKTYEHVVKEKVHICMSKKDLFPVSDSKWQLMPRLERMEAAVGLQNATIQSQSSNIQAQNNRLQALSDNTQAQNDRLQTLSNKIQAQNDRLQALSNSGQAQNDKLNLVEQSFRKMDLQTSEIYTLLIGKQVAEDLIERGIDILCKLFKKTFPTSKRLHDISSLVLNVLVCNLYRSSGCPLIPSASLPEVANNDHKERLKRCIKKGSINMRRLESCDHEILNQLNQTLRQHDPNDHVLKTAVALWIININAGQKQNRTVYQEHVVSFLTYHRSKGNLTLEAGREAARMALERWPEFDREVFASFLE
ncbi:hypothetical protein VNI00_006617 [Paramarasmius palmivorus]|uniref:Uncharacterized protein n=1 Tax=Paramarasmius palmivorus TaxID=297713 RepID=A0AAW0D529_9AGAR